MKPEDIPAFDYASQPNLLDQPHSVMAQDNAKRRKRSSRKQGLQVSPPTASYGLGRIAYRHRSGAGIVEVPTFGARPARDLSQPKQGNKSGTFAR